jgi:hypothetical protein
LALLLCVVLPAYSWLDGSGWLAWTMFAKSETYRLRLRVTDAEGTTHLVNPTALAEFAQGDAASYLTGTDRFRHAPVGEGLRRNLHALAALGCKTMPNSRAGWLALETRANLDANVVESNARVSCDGPRPGALP